MCQSTDLVHGEILSVRLLRRRDALEISLPRHFERKGEFRENLLLDPGKADLKAKDPRFYLRGCQLSRLLPEDQRDLLRSDLKNVYAHRFKRTVDIAVTATDQEYTSAVKPLAHLDQIGKTAWSDNWPTWSDTAV